MKYVQRKRILGWRVPANTKYCGRPGKFGNDAKIGELNHSSGKPYTAEEAVEFYRRMMDYAKEHFTEQYEADIAYLSCYDALSCWCAPGDSCHVQDVLIPIVEERQKVVPLGDMQLQRYMI